MLSTRTVWCTTGELEALRRERQALEARNRRHGEIGQHVSAARQLGYARRMQELQADAEAPHGERAQENVPPPAAPSGGKGGKSSLEQARQRHLTLALPLSLSLSLSLTRRGSGTLP